jgi:hypothetical protein
MKVEDILQVNNACGEDIATEATVNLNKRPGNY